jgi:hypothetical protein
LTASTVKRSFFLQGRQPGDAQPRSPLRAGERTDQATPGVHCYEREEEIPADLAEQLKIIDRIYPELRIDLILVKGRFGPELIERLSQRLGVPKNYMFIGTPRDRFPHNFADLGGVRLIM